MSYRCTVFTKNNKILNNMECKINAPAYITFRTCKYCTVDVYNYPTKDPCVIYYEGDSRVFNDKFSNLIVAIFL